MLSCMNALAHFARIVSLCIVGTSILPAWAATPVVPDQRDGRVLEALLLHLLADQKFDMAKVLTNGAVIVLHARTPEKTGFLKSHQIRSDIGNRTLPADAERDLQQRNSPSDATPDMYDAVTASFTNLTFSSEGIAVVDLTRVLSQRRSPGAFEITQPKARGWVQAYLPGYSKDGTRAVVRAGVGPSAHGAMVTALLEKTGDRWVVKWHHITWYA